MKHLAEYRDAETARRLAAEIGRIVTQPWAIMEVCGGQTHSIIRNGIDQLLPAEPGPSRVRLSVAHELSAALAAMADVSGAVAGGTIFDAVIVDRPGFRAVGAIGAPLADLLVITDLPYFAGELQIGLPWIERRALLEELVAALARPSLVTMTEVRPIERDGSATTSGGTVAPAMLGLVRDIDAAYLARPAR